MLGGTSEHFLQQLQKIGCLRKKGMDCGKFICKQTEKGALETGESADGGNLKNEKKEIGEHEKL